MERGTGIHSRSRVRGVPAESRFRKKSTGRILHLHRQQHRWMMVCYFAVDYLYIHIYMIGTNILVVMIMKMNQPSEINDHGVQSSSSSLQNESQPPLLRAADTTTTASRTIGVTPWYHDPRFTQHIVATRPHDSPDDPNSDVACQQQQQQLPLSRYSNQQPESSSSLSSLWMKLQPQRQRLEELYPQIQHHEATLQILQQQSDQACWKMMSQNVENQKLYGEWRKKHGLDEHIP